MAASRGINWVTSTSVYGYLRCMNSATLAKERELRRVPELNRRTLKRALCPDCREFHTAGYDCPRVARWLIAGCPVTASDDQWRRFYTLATGRLP
jgi:hypothetical protein